MISSELLYSSVNTSEFNPEKLSTEDSKVVVRTRQDVTETQLDTAIWLWFMGMDAVSICTLASAALEILTQLGKKTGKSSHIYNKEMHKLLGKKLKMAPNFFKHASTDPNHVLKFAPAVNEFLLIDALNLYGKIYGSLSPLMNTFRAWFVVVRGRGRMRSEELQIMLPQGALIEDLIKLSRREFIEKVFPAFREE